VTPIPGPFIVLILPLLAALLVFLLRRWALPAALLSATVSGALATLCLRLPLDAHPLCLSGGGLWQACGHSGTEPDA